MKQFLQHGQRQNNNIYLTKQLFIVLILMIFLIKVQSINQSCSSNSNCPNNSTCNPTNYCQCNQNWIVNCLIPAQPLSNANLTFTLTQKFQYFTIVPNSLNNYLMFTFSFYTTQNSTVDLIVSLWGQTGFLTDLISSNQLSQIQFNINQSSSPKQIQTSYFSFGIQPNGQSQLLYLGLRANSTSPVSYSLTSNVVQASSFNSSTFHLIVTILMIVISLSCLILIGFCIYKRRRASQQLQRAQKQSLILKTQHFQQFMPMIQANCVNIPLQICSVCLIQILTEDQIRVTICRHLFHLECIDSWCKKSVTCPVCRQELDKESCQRILGHEFDLSQRTSQKKQQQPNNDIHIQQYKYNPAMVQMSNINQSYQVTNRHQNYDSQQDNNTLRRNML